MATVDKNFRVKNGLNVAGNATISGAATFESNVNVDNLILNATPIAFDPVTGRLQINIGGTWQPIAFVQDVTSNTSEISFMDIGLSIDYNGQPVYTVSANGVNTTGTKFADGGSVTTEAFSMTFDPGTIN